MRAPGCMLGILNWVCGLCGLALAMTDTEIS